jgi:eukaryotic-like serine/threonine-protein kinase
MQPYRDYRGVMVIGAWAWLKGFDFALITEVDADEAFAARRYVNLILLLMLVLLAGISLFGLSSSFAVVRLVKRVKEGTQLGPYTLMDRIGEGGLGEVYLARHALLRRPTAIKLLKPESVDVEALGRFEREVQLASQLTCPNTIAVYDFGRTLEGTFYCAMEYLDGRNLSQVVRASGDLEPARVVHVLRGACASLGEAHARGLVHRDVKPMNLMLCVQGGRHDVVKLLDFGLVKELGADHDEQLTKPQRISGTLLYLAPERLKAPDSVDARTDIYSLGAVAYFLLTGKHHLSGGTDVDLLDRILREEPQPPSQATDQPIPPELDALVLACLSKEMDERPADTAVVVAALDAIGDLEPWTEADAARWWRAHHG